VATSRHRLRGGVREPQQRERVELRVAKKAFAIELQERPVLARSARVVDQEVDRPLVRVEPRLRRGDPFRVRQVGGEDLDLHAVVGAELRRQPLEHLAAPRDDHQVRAASGELAGKCLADAFRRARHERPFPRCALGHVDPPSLGYS
jgi:hypothetical protein